MRAHQPHNNFRAFLLSYYNTRPRALGTTTVQATGLSAELLRAAITSLSSISLSLLHRTSLSTGDQVLILVR
jgi:hypothetical protein